MSEQLRESISALMDGEADELELRRVLAAAGKKDDDTIRDVWSRYHTTRSVMQGDISHTQFKHLDISQQVSAAISEESITAVNGNSWFKPLASMAVAASVAFAVVVGVEGLSPDQGLNPIDENRQQIAANNNNRVYPIQSGSLQASTNSTATVDPSRQSVAKSFPPALLNAESDEAMQKRFEGYILRHTEQAALNNNQGMMSYARVVAYEEEK